MTPPRCRAAGCGRFVAAGTDLCGRHATEPDRALEQELEALRYVLGRLVREMSDLEALARHVPRVSSVAIQATRVQHQLGEGERERLGAILGPVLAELDGAE